MLGLRIRELRKERGLSLCSLAKQANVSKSYLSQIERGMHQNPSLLVLNKVANTLKIPVDSLLFSEGMSKAEEAILDREWREMVIGAIRDGMKKEDFIEYLRYMKYETWRKEHLAIDEEMHK
ncbi:helix-turn-helix domain-containing protein [Bacillus sp. FJAT-27245]|uniref:helix-turn-helix domain-containing protein n=1 Tax=Bacillus sp. FJAT-27245 TaxID=1684144 RepID=UPI0006A7BB76|nr:helix-turn-helix transcriptional regulator [Bacillus sp. FJAT-27245]